MTNEESVMKKCVSMNFIEYVLQKYPALNHREDFRRFFLFLCFGAEDAGSGLLLIPYATVARLAKKTDQAQLRNFKAAVFLKTFKDKVLNSFTWNEYEAADLLTWDSQGKCRTVKDRGLDAETLAMVRKEIDEPADRRFYFDSMKVFNTPNKRKEIQSTMQAYDEMKKSFNLNQDQTAIMTMIQPIALSGEAYLRKLTQNKNTIEAAIQKLPEEDRDLQKKILGSIQEDGRIYYCPTPLGRTPRLHHSTECVISLKRDVRKAFCGGWTEMDLKSSQHVILAYILNAPLNKAFVSNPTNNTWRYMHKFVTGKDESPDPASKEVYKTLVYGICFGMPESTIRVLLEEGNAICLLENPLVKELLEYRGKWFDLINENRYVTDAWGNYHYIKSAGRAEDIYGNTVFTKKRWAGSLAGTKIQSIEFAIMAAMAPVIAKNASVQVTLWQHDGVCLSFTDKRDQTIIQYRLQKALQKKGEEIGMSLIGEAIPVFAEFTNLQGDSE